MKAFLVVLALIGFAAAEEWAPRNLDALKAIRNECLASTPLSADQIEAMKKMVYPDEESVRKYILCCAEKLNIFCEHEGYHVDRVVKQFKLKLDEAEATAIVEKCVDKNEQKSSADVWAYRGQQCLMSSKIGEGIKEFLKNQVHKKN